MPDDFGRWSPFQTVCTVANEANVTNVTRCFVLFKTLQSSLLLLNHLKASWLPGRGSRWGGLGEEEREETKRVEEGRVWGGRRALPRGERLYPKRYYDAYLKTLNTCCRRSLQRRSLYALWTWLRSTGNLGLSCGVQHKSDFDCCLLSSQSVVGEEMLWCITNVQLKLKYRELLVTMR